MKKKLIKNWIGINMTAFSYLENIQAKLFKVCRVLRFDIFFDYVIYFDFVK